MTSAAVSPGVKVLLLVALAAGAASAQAHFPDPEHPGGPIFSFMAQAGRHPLTLYLHFALQTLVWAGWGYLAWRWRSEAAHIGRTIPRWVQANGWDGISSIAAATLFACWALTAAFHPPGEPLDLMFHEGEWLGTIPSLGSWERIRDGLFLIHGFGVDVLPALIAKAWGQEGALIAAARMARMALYLGFALGLWAVIAAIVHGAVPKGPGRGVTTLFATAAVIASFGILWSFGSGTNEGIPLRRAFLLPQVALALWLLSARSSTTVLVVAGFLGVSVPTAFLWNLGDAAVGAGVASVAACALIARNGIRAAAPPMLACAIGAVGASIGAASLLPGVWGTVLGTAAYWSLYGREIWMSWVPDFAFAGFFVWFSLAFFAWAALATAGATRKLGLIGALRTYPQAAVLLAGSALAMRAPLELGFPHYFGAACLLPTLLVLERLVWARATLLARGASAIQALGGPPAPRAFLALLLAPLAVTAASPRTVPAALIELSQGAGTPDTRILRPATAVAVAAIRPIIAASNCTTVLDSSAAWYYLLDLPSCSRFYSPIQAAAPVAQTELVASLEAARPPFIVYSIPADDVNRNVPARERLPSVFQYVDANYEFLIEVEGVALWRRKH